MKRWTAVLLAAAVLLACAGIACAGDGWTCPKCGRENPERAVFCGGCRTPKPDDLSAVTVFSNAWVCRCGEVCSDEDSFCMFCGEPHYEDARPAILTAEVEMRSVTPEPAVIETYSGTFRSQGEQREIRYTAPVSGSYRFWLDRANSGFRVMLDVYDSANYRLNRDYVTQGSGITVELEAGKTYTLYAHQHESLGDYTVRFGIPRQWLHLEGRQTVNDSVAFGDQQNRYKLYAPVSGDYHVWIARAKSGLRFRVEIKDDGGYLINRDYFGQNGGITAALEAGKVYDLVVSQHESTGEYTMNIGMAPATVDLAGCDTVGDRVYFHDQDNTYQYVATESSEHTFTVTKALKDMRVRVEISDGDGYLLNRDYLQQGDSLQADLKEGQKYIVHVRQHEGLGDYVLDIGH